MGKKKKVKTEVYPEPITLPRSRKDTGFKAAKLGGAIGLRFGGPYGVLVGTIAGFAVGVVIDEVLEG